VRSGNSWGYTLIRFASCADAFASPKQYGDAYFFKSLAYSQLLGWRLRWYPNHRKRVPLDLRLTPIVAYWWFIGDGSVSKGRYDLKLSTDGFTNACRGHLVTELQALGIDATVNACGSMSVPAIDVPVFYELVGPCRNPEYSYKWDYIAPRWTFRRNGLRGVRCREL
jgi:hypothetical protein